MSASPDPSTSESESNETAIDEAAARRFAERHLEAEEPLTIVARFATRAHPHTVDPDYKRVVDDLEWGLF